MVVDVEKTNPVEEYLKANSGKKLALKTIYRDLSMKRKKTIWLIHQSDKIINVNPLDVGSNKYFLHVYTYAC